MCVRAVAGLRWYVCACACVRAYASTCVLVLGHMLVRGHDVHAHVHERNLWSKEKARSRLAARRRVAAGKTVPIGKQRARQGLLGQG